MKEKEEKKCYQINNHFKFDNQSNSMYLDVNFE